MARTDDITHFLTDVAAAIKIKLGDNTNIPASNFDTAILNIESTGTYQVKSITINTNTTTVVAPDVGYNAIEQLTVITNVPTSSLQDKSYVFNTNQMVTLLPDNGYDGFNSVGITVNVPSGGKTLLPDGTKFQGSTFSEINLNKFDTSIMTDMSYMFANCDNIINFDAGVLNTSNVTNMYSMFSDCNNLAEVNLTNFNISNVTVISHMFKGCDNLNSINLTNLNMGAVTHMVNTFTNCTNLTDINLANLITGNIVSISGIIAGCSNLVNIDIGNFDLSHTESLNPFTNIVYNCTSLSNASMNSIMKAISTSPRPSSLTWKTLARCGFSQTQANICITLPSWELLNAKGWTTGY